ncbi:hypothetical protein Sango_1780600 [Sesamum angolense]|uniref:Uncharacterized protein n=1 Tax=Sesamum angolense TaxID=2727404 RepID=A0AAE1WGS8_9LAMI|nr:hypothetical protein Sango_1780600 [Sesamum angolense]
MLSVARTCEASRSACDIWNLLWELSSECLDLEPADGPRYFDPTIQELRKQAATSYFNCVFQTSKEVVEDDLLMRSYFPSPATRSLRVVGMEVVFSRFQERLIRSMSDTSYEVRIATLKWLLLFLKRRESLGNNNGDQFYSEAMKICSTIFDLHTVTMLLVSEKHHKCMHYLLKIFYTWNSLGFQDNQLGVEPRYVCNMDCHSIFKLWNMLVSLLKVTRHAKTRQTLICCLGICAKQISNLCMRFLSSEVEKIKIAELIQTDPSKMFSDFYESLSYFVDLIEQSSDASQPVNMRKAAAESMIASGLLAHAEVLGSLILRYPVSDGSLCSNFKPEEAISLFARKVLDLWLTCIKLLEDEDVGLRKRLALDVQKCFTSRDPRKHFPATMASSQVEKVIELCFEHLSTIFGHWLDYLDYLCCWVLNAANSSNYTVSGDLVRRVFDKEIDNHHEEKLLICQICCSHLEEEHDNFGQLLSEVSGLGEAIDPFLGNPLISNLFSIVVNSHEKYLGATADNLPQSGELMIPPGMNSTPIFYLGLGNMCSSHALASCETSYKCLLFVSWRINFEVVTQLVHSSGKRRRPDAGGNLDPSLRRPRFENGWFSTGREGVEESKSYCR